VEAVRVEVKTFNGMPEATAVVRGRLSREGSVLVDAQQFREDGTLFIEVLEHVPNGGQNRVESVSSEAARAKLPFQSRIPVNVLGLERGRVYTVDTNGVLSKLRLPTEAEIYGSSSVSTVDPSILDY
ncbi:MAG: hypothetical protein AAF226_14320, partial [Verrucomicrobiota bacterium]